MTERWTHNGKPVGQPQRPWRLTRARRVEMEAALARLRGDVRPFLGISGCHAQLVVQGSVPLKADQHLYAMYRRNEGTAREWRVYRARVAIALRAALRADEDARCEVVIYESDENDADALREWPPLRRTRWAPSADAYTVPLALWEVEERRRRETVRVVAALLMWGLS